MKKRKPGRKVYVYRYTLFDVMLASPTELLPLHLRQHQLTRMYQGLEALEKAPKPTTEDWRLVSDAVNLMETLITKGPWPDCRGDLVEVNDSEGLLQDAVTALALAGKRHKAGASLRLDGAGIQASSNLVI